MSVAASCVFAAAECPGACPREANNSIDMAASQWDGSCGCANPSFSDVLANTTESLSCSQVLIAFALAPRTPEEKEICQHENPTSQVVSVSIVASLYFLIPILILLVVWMRKHKSFVEILAKLRRSGRPAPKEIGEHSRVSPARLTFRDVRYRVNKDLELLKGVTGELKAQTLTAILGPSGCGKTTLLNLLAKRGIGNTNKASGCIRLDGRVRDNSWKQHSAYVEQFDALFPYLTVKEMLTYTAELRLPGRSPAFVEEAVQRVLKDLELTHVQDSMIGDPVTRIGGISGGQSRRVTVGVELIVRPRVLFLDEPTTGLDSASAGQLVATLKRLVLVNGCTIACTIHQPRSSTFAMFDQLILLKAGEVAYVGPTGASLRAYLKGLNLAPRRDVNVADFIVDLTYESETGGEDKKKTTKKSKKKHEDQEIKSEAEKSNNEEDDVRAAAAEETPSAGPTRAQIVSRLAQAWRESEEAKALLRSIHAVEALTPVLTSKASSEAASSKKRTVYSQPLTRQIEILILRGFRNESRNRGLFNALLLQQVQYLFYGLLFVGLRFAGPDSSWNKDRPGDIPDVNVGLNPMQRMTRNFLFQVMNTVCIVESLVIASAAIEKRVFVREHAAGAFSVVAFHAKWFIRLTADAVWKGFTAAILCYFFPPTRMEADAFFFFGLTLAAVSSVGSSLAFCMTCATGDDPQGAANIHNTISGFMAVYCGFYLPYRLLPDFTAWAYYISFLTYAFEALELNEFGPCISYSGRSFTLSLDASLTRWTNLLILLLYPLAFHAIALFASVARTRPVLSPKCGGSGEFQDVAAEEAQGDAGPEDVEDAAAAAQEAAPEKATIKEAEATKNSSESNAQAVTLQ